MTTDAAGPIEMSVVILTYFGEKYLREVLAAVVGQKADFLFEVLIVDSGSGDGTLEIAAEFTATHGNVRIKNIPPAEFNHGGTRNLGAATTTGEYVAFLTQDATPADERWLVNLRACFAEDPGIVAVFGKHLPRPGCNPITKRDIVGVFSNISPGDTPVVQSVTTDKEKADLAAGLSPVGFYSDVNSCVRRDYWEKHKYPEVDYAEDQIFGHEVLLNGYKKAYCPAAAVYHSHDYPPREWRARYFDEYRGLNKAIGYRDETALIKLIPIAARGAARDAKMVMASGETTGKGRIYWSRYAWRMNFARAVGAYLGGRHNALPGWLTRHMSLEDRRKGRT